MQICCINKNAFYTEIWVACNIKDDHDDSGKANGVYDVLGASAKNGKRPQIQTSYKICTNCAKSIENVFLIFYK